ncbi:hypothetical protein TNCV_77951 [Trichonephila clavipes]|nr:hypothetical protein TNCV_77951 [Trichonephila clavipes]
MDSWLVNHELMPKKSMLKRPPVGTMWKSDSPPELSPHSRNFHTTPKLLSTLLQQKRKLTWQELTFTAAVTQVKLDPHDRAGNKIPNPTSNINRV